MSGSKDELKDLFESAFAAESVPFSDNAWADMNAMLNKRNKRGAFWYWLAGIATTGLAILALIPFFSNANQEYHPRLSNTTFESVGTQTALPEYAVSGAESQPNAIGQHVNSTDDTTEENASKRSNASVGSYTGSNASTNRKANSSGSNLKDENELLANQNPANTETSVSTNPSNSIAEAGEANKETLESELNLREDLEWMNTLGSTLSNSVTIKDNSRNIQVPYFLADRWHYYMLFGLSKSADLSIGLYQSIGQRLGGGLTYKFRDHVYISSEVSLARDDVNIINAETFTYYGFGKENYTIQSGTYEMINLNIPILAHYRWNRWNVGGGIFFDYLSSMKIEETSTKNSTQESVVLQDGYFRWNQYRSMNFGLSMDAHYQLNENFFIGARSSFGFRDLTKADLPVRKNRSEVYLKYHFRK